MDRKIWEGKKVLITGHTGFKGSWLSIWLTKLGAQVLGVSLEPKHALDNFHVSKLDSKIKSIYLDIKEFYLLNTIFKEFKPDIVFHLAAQALVGTAYAQPRTTFETNIIGTLNVLEAIRNNPFVKVGVIITSDKCYKNVEQIWGYRETDTLGGDDPYSASKGGAELVINSYIKNYFNKGDQLICSARAGNVMGGGDWSENRIVPDCFRSLFSGSQIIIRSPQSTRPWQFVLEPLRGYILLGEKLLQGMKEFSGSWNFGPSIEKAHTVQDVVKKIITNWGSGDLLIEQNNKFHENKLLQLDCTKSRMELGWKPVLSFEEIIRFTTEWYKYLYPNQETDMHDFCLKQIEEYETLVLKHEN